jgi:hypothetical protein
MADIFPAQTRRTALVGVLAAASAGPGGAAPTAQAAEAPTLPVHTGGPNDFDFLAGRWTVRHRWLKTRLAGGSEWLECDGTMELRPTLGGQGNCDDNVVNRPDGAYRAMSVRAFDPETRQWSIWWVDGRSPSGPLDPPVRGGFENGVGRFLSHDSFNGKPVVCRFIWSGITATAAHWEQAFSSDGGATWETNWHMAFTRAD